ncbi:acyl-CoA/acyl-ACP dehydrogenase [Nocardia sp. NBC_01377]|uniref:acyl-CoA dehydrogenase family protein n=1 Tax=Nocardia sp. NBC_01377 TaxID=2903595 RepID=UPI00324C986F
MLLDATSDQNFFRSTTAQYLTTHVPVTVIRALREHPDGYDRDYWRRGADLGWTSLLAEDDGQGVSGRPLVDLTLLAYEFGRHSAPGPLVPVNVVADALHETASHPDVLEELRSGSAIATWCCAEPPPHHTLGAYGLRIRVDGSDLVIDGVKRPVESAQSARYFLVSGQSEDGLTQVLVPAHTPGISVTPLRSIDLVRRFGTVVFDNVRVPGGAAVGDIGGAAEQIERQLQVALVVQCAETVGAMQIGFDMTVGWAADRYAFGRPLDSYQALKHRFADMKSWLEASHAIADTAAAAVADRRPDADSLASAAQAYIGQHSVEVLQDCVQLHGGIGLTFEHDLHLFLRRATMNRMLHGTPSEHRRRIANRVVEERISA